ncbi:pre-60S factor rei1 [Coemansia spiralis]|nr:pre-60S factor rei1 [Coemansia spiralis]
MPLFTCIACQVAFYSADQQRTHYRSDWHRYNLKRKVAELPPVTAESFAQRVLAQQAKTAEAAKRAEFSAECTVCMKAYSSENAFNNHLSSKKHKEREAKMVHKMQRDEDLRAEQSAIEESIASAVAATATDAAAAGVPTSDAAPGAVSDSGAATDGLGRKVSAFPVSDDDEDEDEDDDEVAEEEEDEPAGAAEQMDVEETNQDADAERARRKQEREIKRQLNQATSEEEVVALLEKKKAAAPRLNPDADCLFCTHKSASFEANMDHMALAHSLFVPDLEYLVDLHGLIKYLADKISVANVCLYCNGRGRMLHSLEAVRKHMADKGHTKIAYDTEIDILEISEFYDFSSTYPDAADHDANEMLDGDDAGGHTRSAAGMAQVEEEDGELVLPNGTRIGHRSLQRYYRQTLPPERAEKDSVVIHKMLTSYTDDPAYSTQLTHASRNRALILSQPKGYQALQATTKFKGKRMFEDFRTRVGIRANGLQRHYREQNPL